MTLTLTKTAADYGRLALDCLAPPQAADFWQWANGNLRMPDGAKWSARRARLARHWYRLVQSRLALRPDERDPYAHRCEQLWLCFGAQIAKTTFLHDVLLYVIKNQPRKVGYFMARLKDLHINRQTKVQRRVLAIPQLERLLPDGEEARERALGALTWAVGSSLVLWLCGNVANDWRSHDLPLILADEIDQYDLDLEKQGDPIDHGLVRQRAYRANKLFVGVSTPGVIHGHTWRRLCSGSHERILLICPHCGAASWPDDQLITLDGDRKLDDVEAHEITTRHLARWNCPHNGCQLDGLQFNRMLNDGIDADRWCPGTWEIDEQHPAGHWTPHADLDAGGRLQRIWIPEGSIRSGWASSLYSLDESLDTYTAKLALSRQGTAGNARAFANNEAAAPYIISVTDLGADGLAKTIPAEAKTYNHGALHRAAKWLALHFDQQGNQWENAWFPWTLRAFEPGGESWLVESGEARSHAERDELERRTWMIGTTPMQAHLSWMDSANGNVLFDIYLWAAAKPSKRLLIRGDARVADGVPWEEVIDTKNNRRRTPKPAGVREWRIHPWHWRNDLWSRITGRADRPRWWRPGDAPQWYLNSLTSEEQVIEKRRVTGGGWRDQVVWRPRLVASTAGKDTFRTDNHWWDSEVSQLAAADILGWNRTPTAAPTRKYGVVGNVGTRPT